MRVPGVSVALVIVAATLGVPSCRRDSGAAANKAAAATHSITIEAVSYKPETLTLNVGDTIVWINKDPFPHTATSRPAGFDSKEMRADGGSWTYTASKAGDFRYVCTLHPTMQGVLHVR
jgi:plastocyanin